MQATRAHDAADTYDQNVSTYQKKTCFLLLIDMYFC